MDLSLSSANIFLLPDAFYRKPVVRHCHCQPILLGSLFELLLAVTCVELHAVGFCLSEE
jgi:hypothetical protein